MSESTFSENIMDRRPRWVEEEVEIVREFYPKVGRNDTQRILESEGYKRSKGSVAYKASELGIRQVFTYQKLKNNP